MSPALSAANNRAWPREEAGLVRAPRASATARGRKSAALVGQMTQQRLAQQRAAARRRRQAGVGDNT
jgi:hypothetical protein